MNGQQLRWLYHRLIGVVTRRCIYGDGLVALIGLFAAAGNRSLRWACSLAHWPLWCQSVLILPSYSQARRRRRTPSVAALIKRVNEELKAFLGRSGDRIGDGKPLPVSGFSKDKDATKGYVPGGFARGYRVHALCDARTGVIDAAVTGLREGEATVMRRLVRFASLSGCVLRCDANYDSNALYEATCARGGRLLAPRKRPGTGLGHRVNHHPHRLAAIEQLESGGRKSHAALRVGIERCFADLTQATGLFALPPFVRRLRRVRPWVRDKLLIYHLNLCLRLAT